MEDNIQKLIEEKYGFGIRNIIPGPRQFVAETYILEADNHKKYFVKLIKHTKHSKQTLLSLPVLENLYNSGITNINYPIKTTDEDLFLLESDTIVIVFNFIDAKQTFEFDKTKFGNQLAIIHSKTPIIGVPIPEEDFSPLWLEDFGPSLNKGLNLNDESEPAQKLQKVLKQFEVEINEDWKDFQSVIEQCKKTNFEFVLTHGDAPGNTLVGSFDELYIIDWDTILLAPRERDTWFLAQLSAFLNGYHSVFPKYRINKLAFKFYLYSRYFDDMIGFIEEILSDKSDEHKVKNFNLLMKDCFEEWLRPQIRNFENLIK